MQGGDAERLKRVDISLNDCLACSGCITSAETVLVTQQSQEEMLRVFEENLQLKQVRKCVVSLIILLRRIFFAITAVSSCLQITEGIFNTIVVITS